MKDTYLLLVLNKNNINLIFLFKIIMFHIFIFFDVLILKIYLQIKNTLKNNNYHGTFFGFSLTISMQPRLKKKKTSHDKKRHVLSRKRCPRKHYKKLMKDTLSYLVLRFK